MNALSSVSYEVLGYLVISVLPIEHGSYVNLYLLFKITDVGSTVCSFKDSKALSLTIAVVDQRQQLLNGVCERGLLSL